MRSYAVTFFCAPVEPIETPPPAPKGTEVVVEVTRCGVCHSDLHLQEGFYDLGGGKKLSLADRGVALPAVLGHEVLGRLVAKGPDAPIGDDQIGRTFVVYPWLGCGTCAPCFAGRDNECPKPSSIGVHRPGGYSEQCLVPHPRYLVDVSGLNPTLAATYACSGLTAYGAVKKAEIDREKDRLLIIGVGGVGLSGLQIAKALGFRHVVVADIDPDKRALALANGADLAVDPRAPEAGATLQSLDGGIAAAVDFVGARATAEFGTSVLRKAGIYVIVGLFGGDMTVSLPMLVLRALTVRGSYVGNLQELRELIELAKAGRLSPLPVEEVPMAEVNGALERLRAGHVKGRLVLTREPV
ncbi:MAG: alcohol dehydrogenase [Pseudomonadota bacterium]